MTVSGIPTAPPSPTGSWRKVPQECTGSLSGGSLKSAVGVAPRICHFQKLGISVLSDEFDGLPVFLVLEPALALETEDDTASRIVWTCLLYTSDAADE